MQLSAWKRMGLIFVVLAAIGCGTEGVGDPCTPETVPSKSSAVGGTIQTGFEKTESYIESNSVQCRSRLCIVHRLDNGKDAPADPRVLCDAAGGGPANCVRFDQLERSVHCTCKCGGPKTSEQCQCPSGFTCREILTLGGDGIRGSYCVKPAALQTQ